MHEEILSEKQKLLLPLIKSFSNEYCLIGGTAIALQIGHRRSIDFDLISTKPINHEEVRRTIRKTNKIEGVMVDEPEELTLIIDGVKTTFLEYPFSIEQTIPFKEVINMPDVLTLATMKAYALGRRAKWKDYVDIYFTAKQKPFIEIVSKAKEIFGEEFNEKLFREELSYFDDVNYSEEVDYMPGFEISKEEVKENLKGISLQK